MKPWIVSVAIIAVVAFLFGFTDLAAAVLSVAKVLFFGALFTTVVTLAVGALNRPRPAGRGYFEDEPL